MKTYYDKAYGLAFNNVEESNFGMGDMLCIIINIWAQRRTANHSTLQRLGHRAPMSWKNHIKFF